MTTIASFEIDEVLRKNERYELYLAHGKGTSERVLLKVLPSVEQNPGEVASLRREHAILEALEIEVAPRVHGYVEDGDRHILVREHCLGDSLRSWLEGDKISVEEFIEVAIAAAKAVGELHAKNIIHKDINPNNLIWDRAQKTLKVIDFGISTKLSREHPQLARVDQLEGTLAYMSPEQTGRMNRPLTYHSDIYSLGATFYSLLTQSSVFQADDALGLIAAHISELPIEPHELDAAIPKTLSDIVVKLLSKNIEDRYQSGFGLVRDLEEARTRCSDGRPDDSFELGQEDVPSAFVLSSKLYGRDAEIEALSAACNSTVEQERPSSFWITGRSGIGKSALVGEIHKTLALHRGTFATGKFDEFSKNMPYTAFRQAFDEIANQLMGLPQDEFQIWVERLKNALGPNIRIITEFVPRFRLILGEGEPLVEVGPEQNANRFRQTLNGFFNALITPDHPVVLFIDDLQWADLSSLKLLSQLMDPETSRPLLFIGAYRDNEVDAAHPLTEAFEKLQEVGGEMAQISLKPLGSESVSELVADTLFCTADRTVDVANRVIEKTGGNPFFVRELLQTIYQENGFNFSQSEGVWTWDIKQIVNIDVTDNVVEFMLQKINKLPDETARYLSIASCMGNRFELVTLAAVLELAPKVVSDALLTAVHEGMLVATAGDVQFDTGAEEVKYRFVHDRVQRAAFQRNEEEVVHATKLRYGQILWEISSEEQREERLIEIVQAKNAGAELISDEDERRGLAELNLRAAIKAKGSTSYEAAAAFEENGLAMLSESVRLESDDLGFTLTLEHAETCFLKGDTEQAQGIFDSLNSLDVSKYKKADIALKHIPMLSNAAEYTRCIDSGLDCLDLFGLKLPRFPKTQLPAAMEIIKTRLPMSRTNFEELHNMPPCTNKDVIACTQIMGEIGDAVYIQRPNLMPILVLKGALFGFRNGHIPKISNVYIGLALIEGCALGDLDRADRLVKAAWAFQDKFDAEGVVSARSQIIYGFLLAPWFHHTDVGVENLLEGIRRAQETGDLVYRGYGASAHFAYLAYLSPNTADYDEQFEKYAAFCSAEAPRNHCTYLMVRQQLRVFRGESEHLLDFPEDEADSREFYIQTNANDKVIDAYSVPAECMTHLMMDNMKDLRGCVKRLDFDKYTGFLFIPYLQLAGILVHLSEGSMSSWPAKVLARAKLKKLIMDLKGFEKRVPENWSWLSLLCQAEDAKLGGSRQRAMTLYYEAHQKACESRNAILRGFCAERAAKFHLRMGDRIGASAYLNLAKGHFHEFQAAGMIRRIDEQYASALEGPLALPAGMAIAALPSDTTHAAVVDEAAASVTDLTRTSSTTKSTTSGGAQLDIESVSKASRMLAGEVVLEELLKKLMSVVREAAAADKGMVLLPEIVTGGAQDASNWKICAEISGKDKIEVFQEEDVATSRNLSRHVVQYVLRAQEALVLGDATQDKEYKNDPYIRKTGVKSILCAPIIQQDKWHGILYLENALSENTFTPERLKLLDILSSQAAISLENAQLYENLEAKVAARTRELAAKNRDIRGMLDNMKQGVLTVCYDYDSDGLTISPDYSTHLEEILETEHLEGRDFMEVMFGKAELGVDTSSMVRDTLASTVGEESWQFEVNSHVLVSECDLVSSDGGAKKIIELDWGFIPDEHENVSKILVVVRDVTEVRALQAQAEAQSRELAMIGEILAIPMPKFRSYLESSQEFIDENRSLIDKASAPESEMVNVLFRNMHTIKGNSRVYHFSQIVDCAHQAEEALGALRDACQESAEKAAELWDPKHLLEGLGEVESVLAEYRHLMEEKLGQMSGGSSDHTVEFFAEAKTILNRPTGDHAQLLKHWEELREHLALSEHERLEKIIEDVVQSVKSLAVELGKPEPKIHVESGGCRFPNKAVPCFRNVFMHLLRNAIDHGIELPEERESSGKSQTGEIHVEVRQSDGRGRIYVWDDGAGLNLDALRKKAVGAGLTEGNGDLDHERVAALVFSDGLSTAEKLTEVSGRGVGMSAVQAELRKLGSEIEVEFTADAMPSGRRPFRFAIDFPDGTVSRGSAAN